MKEQDNLIGNLICEARKKKKLTQQELAKLLNVSDKTISAWETGKNSPDLGVLKNVSKYLDIDLIGVLSDKECKKCKKIIKIILIAFLVLFLVCYVIFSLYFFSNFGKIKIYEIKLDSRDYVLDSGLIISTPNKIIFNFGDISHNLEIEEDMNISLYYLDGENKEEIISKFNYDFLYYESFNKYLRKVDDIEKFVIEISYRLEGKIYKIDIPLILEEKISNNKLIYIIKTNESSDSEIRLKVLLHNVGYKKYSDIIYIKEYVDDNIKYTYDIDKNTFSYIFTDGDFVKNGVYYVNENKNYFYVIYNDYIIEEFTYENQDVNCKLGKCKNSEEMINLLLEEYKKLK